MFDISNYNLFKANVDNFINIHIFLQLTVNSYLLKVKSKYGYFSSFSLSHKLKVGKIYVSKSFILTKS